MSHPDSLARQPIDPVMRNSFGATSSRAPDITIKPKLLPWYEMMTLPCPNSDGGGANACEVTYTTDLELELVSGTYAIHHCCSR